MKRGCTMAKGIFVSGTGTDVGKTYVAGLLVKALREAGKNAGYYKAAASGNVRTADGKILAGDAREVCRLSGLDADPEDLITFLYEEAVSPHLASRSEGEPVSIVRVMQHYAELAKRFEFMVAEGSGGIICPIRWDSTERLLLEDVIHALGLDTVLVADAGLGTINHTVLTVEYARSHGLTVRGIILNRYEDTPFMRDNRAMIEELSGVRVVGTVSANGSDLSILPEDLFALFR